MHTMQRCNGFSRLRCAVMQEEGHSHRLSLFPNVIDGAETEIETWLYVQVFLGQE